MERIACFPGSFDPFTKGHEDVVNRGLELFDTVIIAVGHNSTKTSFFEIEKRIEHIKSCFHANQKIIVKTYDQLTVDFCVANNCKHILRGLRDTKDFGFEQPIAIMNRQLAQIDTVFVLPNPDLMAINSTIVREIYKNGGKIDSFVTNAHLLV